MKKVIGLLAIVLVFVSAPAYSGGYSEYVTEMDAKWLNETEEGSSGAYKWDGSTMGPAFGVTKKKEAPALVDVVIDDKGNALAIFRKVDSEGGDIEKIRLDYITKKNALAMSDFIYPTYVGRDTQVFILPTKLLKSRFNISFHTSQGKAKYVVAGMQPLK